MTNERNVGLDVARIVSMLGIVILHINGVGGVLRSCENIQSKFLISNWIEICAFTSVDLFGLLSGYLCINKKNKTCYRTIDLICILLFYCISITAIFLVISPDKVGGIKAIILGFVRQFQGTYWYIICYIPLSVFQPYINKMILSLNVKEHLRLTIVMIAIFGFIQSSVKVDLFLFKNGYSFVWLLCLYIIGSYIRRIDLFGEVKHIKVKTMVLFFVCSIVLLIGNMLIIKVIHRSIQYFVSYISPIIVIMSVCLLLFFRDIKINSCRWIISVLSKMTFDVYLIHCHILIYDNFIKTQFAWIESYSVFLIPLLVIGCAIIIFTITSIIGGVRSFIWRVLKLDVLFQGISAKLDSVLYGKAFRE